MDDRKMVHQINQIAAYFAAYPEPRASDEVQTHIRKFYEPRIRRQLLEYDGDGLHPLAQTAVTELRAEFGY